MDGLREGRLRGERGRVIAFLAAWIASLFLVYAAVAAVVPTPAASGGRLRASLKVAGPSWTIAYAATTVNTTVFAFLHEASQTLGFELEWVEHGWPYEDVFVVSINGTRMDGARNLWWQYCVNGEYADRGARHFEVRDGDAVRWVYAPPGGDDLCR